MYMANTGRMNRDWYFVICENPETGEHRSQTGEASCLAEARRYIFAPNVLEKDWVFTIVRLRAGQWFEDPVEYDHFGTDAEAVSYTHLRAHET